MHKIIYRDWEGWETAQTLKTRAGGKYYDKSLHLIFIHVVLFVQLIT